MIACHVWDTIGARAAGLQAGLIVREGNAPLDIGPQPDYIGEDLDASADQLIDRWRMVADPKFLRTPAVRRIGGNGSAGFSRSGGAVAISGSTVALAACRHRSGRRIPGCAGVRSW